MRALGIILAGGNNFKMRELSNKRAIAAMPVAGSYRAIDFAQEEIKEILINLKRVDFINRVKEDLYRQASDKNEINYLYLKSDE